MFVHLVKQPLSSDLLVSYITGWNTLFNLFYLRKTTDDLFLHFHNTICTSFLKAEVSFTEIKNHTGLLLIHISTSFSVTQTLLLSNQVTITPVSATSDIQSYLAPHMTAAG